MANFYYESRWMSGRICTNNFHTEGAEKDKELNHRTQVDADEFFFEV